MHEAVLAAGLPVEAAVHTGRDLQKDIAVGRTIGAEAGAEAPLRLELREAEATTMTDTLILLPEVDTRAIPAVAVDEVVTAADISSQIRGHPEIEKL